MTVITKAIALKAVLMGACSPPVVGANISSLPTSHLIWAEDRQLVTHKELKEATGSDLPLWVRSGDGDGDGYGYGDGDGYGYGYGYGYGDGDGDGYGKLNEYIQALTKE